MSNNKVLCDTEEIVNIANAVRDSLGTEDTFKVSELGDAVSEVYEAGKQTEYDKFWDAFQKNGKRNYYYYGFSSSYYAFNDENYNPKYPIICEGSSGGTSVFYGADITDTKVPIELKTSGNSTFLYASNLKTIRKLIVYETTTFDKNIFVETKALENITIEGVIGNDLIISSSKILSKASIESIINALSSTVTAKTLTLNKTAIQNAFGTDYDSSTEWTTLKNSKSNWTITLS